MNDMVFLSDTSPEHACKVSIPEQQEGLNFKSNNKCCF